MVRITFRTHFYEWEGSFYRQVSGGPIGLRATGPVSSVLMDFWASEIQEICTKSKELSEKNPVRYEGMDLHLLHKYVDDCFAALKKLRSGVRWCQEEGALIWKSEWELEDREQGVDREVTTMKALSSMASSVLTCLNFT